MKKLLLLSAIVIAAAGCNQPTAESSEGVKLVSSIITSYPNDSIPSDTVEYVYDAQNRLEKMFISTPDGNKTSNRYSYSNNNTHYTFDTGHFIIKGNYTVDDNGRINEVVEKNIMPNVEVTGINKIKYIGNKMSEIVSTSLNGEKIRSNIVLNVEWTGNDMTQIKGEWSSHDYGTDSIRTCIKKEYTHDLKNLSNFDLNFVIERTFLTGTFLALEPFVMRQCGDVSEHMMSSFVQDIEFKNATEKNLVFSYTFKYEQNEDSSIKQVNVIDPDGNTQMTISINYK